MGDVIGLGYERLEDPGQSLRDRVNPLEVGVQELGEPEEVLSGPRGVGADAGDILGRRTDLVLGNEIPLQRVDEVVIRLIVGLALKLEVEVELRSQSIHEHLAVAREDPVRHIGHEHDPRAAGRRGIGRKRIGFWSPSTADIDSFWNSLVLFDDLFDGKAMTLKCTPDIGF